MKTTNGEHALTRVLNNANKIMSEHRERVPKVARKHPVYVAELGRIIAWIVVLIQLGTPHQNFSQ
jgi:hypothetical protein